MTRAGSHTDDYQATELQERNDVCDVVGLLQHVHPPQTEDANDESGKITESLTRDVVAVTGRMRETVVSHDAGSSDPISALTAADDGAHLVEGGVVDLDTCHAAAFTCDDRDKLDMDGSTKYAEADRGKLDTAHSAESDETFVASSDGLDAAESDGCHEACTRAAAIDAGPSSETFPADADRLNTNHSVECVRESELDSSEKHRLAETADDVSQASAVADSNEHTSCNSLISQLKSALTSALSGCTVYLTLITRH